MSAFIPDCLRASIRLLFFGWPAIAAGWQPGTSQPTAASGFVVNTEDRRDVLAFHHCVYQASENYAANMTWTGSVASGNAGTTSATFKEDVRRRVNYYRALSGLPADIVFNATKSAKCQQAALMMSANDDLDHTPPTNWDYYTADGAEAAGNSNLALGTYGPDAIDGYMVDPGGGNQIVGHRRWILYSRAAEMGTGDIPWDGSYYAANSLWVLYNFKSAPTPKFVAWPNAGYVPISVMPARWSLSYPGADFSNAIVNMTINGVTAALTVVSRTDNGYGDNTIVWEPVGLPSNVTADVPCVVTVTGIQGSGVPTSKSYTVRLFNPELLGEQIAISGPANPATSGANYSFNPIAQTDLYELEVCKLNSQSWTEGAEDSPAPQIQENISAGYALRQSGLFRSGSKAFQLTHPEDQFGDQSFTITRKLIPSSSSQLTYFDRARWSASTTTLETQISTDDGASWSTLASRYGVSVTGYSSEWDTAWIARSASLSAYAGKIVSLRFIMKRNGASVYQGTSANYGFFIDDISVSNASQVESPTVTTLAGSASGFTLDAGTAGAALVEGSSYTMRMRPNVGCRWFTFGEHVTVTASAPPSGFATWAANQEGSHGLPAGALADPQGDHDRDGRCELLEYAFGGSPVSPDDSGARLPLAERTATHVILRYQIDTSLGDLTLVPQACTTLGEWNAPGASGAPAGFSDDLVSTIGGIETREAKLPITAGSRGFLRLSVSRP